MILILNLFSFIINIYLINLSNVYLFILLIFFSLCVSFFLLGVLLFFFILELPEVKENKIHIRRK